MPGGLVRIADKSNGVVSAPTRFQPLLTGMLSCVTVLPVNWPEAEVSHFSQNPRPVVSESMGRYDTEYANAGEVEDS